MKSASTTAEKKSNEGHLDAPAAPAGTPPEAPPQDRAARESFRDFLRKFAAHFKARTIYPSGHSRPQKLMEEWARKTSTLLQAQTEICISVNPGSLTIHGEKFAGEIPAIPELSAELLKRLVRRIFLKKGAGHQELDNLAALLFQKPEEIGRGKSVETFLKQYETARLQLVAFKYDTAATDPNPRNSQDQSPPDQAETEGEPSHEKSVQPEELEHSEEDWKESLHVLSQPEIIQKLDMFCHRLEQMPRKEQACLNGKDFLLHLVHAIEDARKELDFEVEDVSEIVLRVLDEVLNRLLRPAAENSDLPDDELLEMVAKETLASSENLLQWLSSAQESISKTLSSRQSALLKAIFRRKKDKDLEGQSQETEQSPAKPSKPSDTSTEKSYGQSKEQREECKEILRCYCELQEKNGGESKQWLQRSQDVVPFMHIDVLFELLLSAQERPGRKSLLAKIKDFLGRQMSQEESGGQPMLARFLDRSKERCTTPEMEDIALSPPICKEALQTRAQGDTNWHSILTRVAQNHSASLAASLESCILDWEGTLSIKTLEHFILLTQDDLVQMLLDRLKEGKRALPLGRIADVALICNTPKTVQLTELLLERVDQEKREALLEHLVQFNTGQAIAVIRRFLNSTDAKTRVSVLRMLGQSKQLLAEEILLDSLMQPGWKDQQMQEKLVALSSLRQCGSARSLHSLRKLARKLSLLLKAKGRLVRAEAAAVYRSVLASHREKGKQPKE